MYYLTETDPRGAMGLGGKEEDSVGSLGGYLTAIDYKTGKVAWRHRYPGTGGSLGNGILTTAGKLLFAGDIAGAIPQFEEGVRSRNSMRPAKSTTKQATIIASSQSGDSPVAARPNP